MNKISTTAALLVMMLGVMSCGLIDRFTGGGVEKLERAEDLWPDVPRMDGLERSDMELPTGVKLLMRAALDNLWRLNKDGEDKSHVTGDWVVFSTAKTPADVQNFYTNDRMTSIGKWDASKKSTCVDGSDKGWPGIFCVYQKKESGKDVGLMIVAGADEKSKQTNVYYLRLESDSAASNSNK